MSSFRSWTVFRFLALAERLRARCPVLSIILTGCGKERRLAEEFATGYSGTAVIACDLGPLERTAALLRRCDLLVSNDTGVMHLGAAMGTPTVGLFGPNTPRHWQPTGPRATYVYATKEICSPCIDNYHGAAPSKCVNQQQGRCMLDIEVDAVLDAIERVAADKFSGARQVVEDNRARPSPI
jgi:heptosyltransferase-2